MLLVTILFWPARGVAAENIKKVALFPFEINSTAPEEHRQAPGNGLSGRGRGTSEIENHPSGRQGTITAAIEGKRIDDALVTRVGRKAGAAYTITGSFTEFGEQISVDVRLIDVHTGKVLPGVYVQGKGRQRLGAILAQLRMDIMSRIAPEQRIARIEFKGNRKIEGSVIKQVLKSAAGDILTDADLSTDIKAIFKMGYFDDVTAEVTDIAEGKVITFIVVEKPMITEIRINGNKALKKDEIEGVMTVRNRQTVNPERLKADMEKIKTLYDSKGFYNAEIRYAIEKEGERDVTVVITIVENEKLFIRNIVFEGNRTFTTKELKNMMTTNEWGIFHFFTDSGLLKKDQLKQDVGKINAFYLNNGFINAQVGEPEITYDREGITIKIPVSEGKQFRVGKVAITGDELTIPRADLLAKLQIRKKDFYDREAIMKDMDYLTQACNDEGFANADVAPRTEPQEKTQTVDVTYEITKRKLVYFNRINITGNTKTRDKVIRRELSVVEGDLYSRTKLKNSYMALNRLRYFEEIDFQTEKGPDETLTDVNIQRQGETDGNVQHRRRIQRHGPCRRFGPGLPAEPLRPGTDPEPQGERRFQLSASTTSPSSNPGSSTCPSGASSTLWNLYREYDSYKLDSKGFGATLGYPLWQYVTGYVGYRLSDGQCEGRPGHGLLLHQETGGRDDEQRRHPHPDPGLDGRCDVPLHRIEEQRLGGIYRRPPSGRCQLHPLRADLLLVLPAAPGHRLRCPRKDRLYATPTRGKRSRSTNGTISEGSTPCGDSGKWDREIPHTGTSSAASRC